MHFITNATPISKIASKCRKKKLKSRGFIGSAIQASFHVNGFGADSHACTINNQLIKLKTTIDIALV